MNTPPDAVHAPESLIFASTPSSERRDEADLAQEINERRARVENAELLQNLRGL